MICIMGLKKEVALPHPVLEMFQVCFVIYTFSYGKLLRLQFTLPYPVSSLTIV